jgi:hypothetical protein
MEGQNLSFFTSSIYKLLSDRKMQSIKDSILMITLILLLSFVGISSFLIKQIFFLVEKP